MIWPRIILLVLVAAASVPRFAFVAAESQTEYDEEEEYRVFPRRTIEEAAVLEWGSSAIITALDASVALFGPQTSDAALLEVETSPVLAVPLDGLGVSKKKEYNEYLKALNKKEQKEQEKTEDRDLGETQQTEEDSASAEAEADPAFEVPVIALENAEEVVGNLCIMTSHPAVTGVELALMAQQSGAAALLVVNIDDPHRPDDIYRLPTNGDPRADSIDIPVVMISLNSAQMLATALLDPESPNSHELARRAGFSAKYMPQRVRLYAGDDRPFFEDVEAARPTIYLIHDLLKADECESLIQAAETAGLNPVENVDLLQYTPTPRNLINVDRVTLWQGLWMTSGAKAIEERMEQVTSFPVSHYSDFVIDRIKADGTSYIKPQYDSLGGSSSNNQASAIPVASMTIFLSEPPANNATGLEIVYPSVIGANSDESSSASSSTARSPILIQPRQGMAVIHHSTDERGQLDTSSLHALLPVQRSGDGEQPEYYYVAHKYIFMEPLSTARRVILPLLSVPGRGRLPLALVQAHDWFVDQFGLEQGSTFFDKACVFVPLLIVLMLVQFIVERVRAHLSSSSVGSSNNSNKSKDNGKTGETVSKDENNTRDISAAASKKKKRTKRD